MLLFGVLEVNKPMFGVWLYGFLWQKRTPNIRSTDPDTGASKLTKINKPGVLPF